MFRPQIQKTRVLVILAILNLAMVFIASNSTITADRQIGSRLAAALAACAQLSALPASQRMWSLQSLRRLMTSGYGATLNIPQMMLISQSSTNSSKVSHAIFPSKAVTLSSYLMSTVCASSVSYKVFTFPCINSFTSSSSLVL